MQILVIYIRSDTKKVKAGEGYIQKFFKLNFVSLVRGFWFWASPSFTFGIFGGKKAFSG